MIKYWPNQQGIELNNEVAYLFSHTKNKFFHGLLHNTTNDLLPIDIIDNYNRSKLFSSVLQELEILILDIIELDLNIENIKLLNHKILCDLVEKSLINLNLNINQSNIIILTEQQSYYVSIFFFEHKLLLENILIYLIFGSYHIKTKIFAFENNRTPQKHVSILLENLIIQISNLTFFILLENIQSLSETINFLLKNKLCNSSYISTRSIALFRNNLMIQSLIQLYINQPKAIYSARYKVWILSSHGLICKYIHTTRLEELSRLSSLKLTLLLLIELQDIFIPYIEKFFLRLGKVLLYIIINILGNSIIFLIRIIISSLYNKDK